MVLEKRRALTMEVETIKDALKEKKLQDAIKVYMGRHGRVTYHNCSSSLIKSRNGTRGIFTKALKVRVHHKDEVDLKSNYEVHKYNESKWVGE